MSDEKALAIDTENRQPSEELRLRQLELDLRKEELRLRLLDEKQKNRFSISPATAALIAAIAGLIGTGLGAYIQGQSNLQLERQKFETSLVLKAIETGDPERAAKNLSFLVKTGFLRDNNGQIAALTEHPENAPLLPSPNLDSSGRSLIEVNADNFKQEVLDSKLPVLVLFSAKWSLQGRALEDLLKTFAINYTNKIKMRKVDVDVSPDIDQKYSLEAYPTIIFFRNGVEEERAVGYLLKEKLVQLLARHVDYKANP